jgi:hypothetical protein
MNTRANLTVVALLSLFAVASSPAKAGVLGFSAALPDLGAVTAEVTKIVAADLTAYMRSALSAPRVARKHQSPTVTIAELGSSTMETVTVVATRLPPLATELAQASSDSYTRL